MKIFMRNNRHDAARDPFTARPGDRQRAAEHGLAAPDHERPEPGRVRALLAAEGLLGHQHANSGWGTFDDDNMVGATAFMETLELAVELLRGDGVGGDLYPYTEDAVGAVKRSVLSGGSSMASRRDLTARSYAPHSRRRTPSARTSSCTPHSARDVIP